VRPCVLLGVNRNRGISISDGRALKRVREMGHELTDSHQQHLDFVKDNFEQLRDCAIEDLTRYTSAWSVYTIDFLNCLAEIQGSDLRLDNSVVMLIRNDDQHRITEPRVPKLLSEAQDARSIKINELIGLLSSTCSKIDAKEAKAYKRLI